MDYHITRALMWSKGLGLNKYEKLEHVAQKCYGHMYRKHIFC